MSNFLRRLVRDEDGATMAEYVMMAFFIGATLATVVGSLGSALSSKFAWFNSLVASAGN